MPRTVRFLLRNPRRFTLILASIALVSYLALPNQQLKWLLPSASATSVSREAKANRVSSLAAPAQGAVSFGGQSFSVQEGDGPASITLTRTGGSDGALSAKINVADVTTSPADYSVSPGALDPTFITPSPITQGAAGTYGYPSMALQPDGKLLVADSRNVWRLKPDGSLDTTFNVGVTNNLVYTLALQPDGKIIIGGGFTTFNNQRVNRIARLNSDGSLDASFDVGAGPNESVAVIVLQPDGKLLVSGYFDNISGTYTSYFGVARLNSNGSIDNSFALNQGLTGRAITLQPDGKILGGSSGGINRANPDGTIDATFNAQFSGIYPWIFNIAVQPDGRVLIVGSFDHVGGQVAYGVARLNTDGSVDPTFNTGTGPDTAPQGLALQPDGKVLIGGGFNSFNGAAVNNLLRLNADGSLDPTFATNVTGSFGTTGIGNILLQPDGKIFIRGYLTATGQNVINKYLARLNNDLFMTWAAGDASNKTVSLPIVDDLLDEPDETLNLTLTPLTSGASTGANASATLTITDNDVPPTITSPLPPSLINLSSPQFFTHTFTATGYPAPTFTITSGSLPNALSLQSSGLLSGMIYDRGVYTVTVQASNGVGTPATQTFTLRVNSLPSTFPDTYFTALNTPITVNAPGVLGNDSDLDGNPLTVTLESNAANGNAVLNADGSFTYTPNPNYLGTDTFTYRVSDGYGTTAPQNVHMQVVSGGKFQFPAGAGFSGREDAGSLEVQILRFDGTYGTTTVAYTTSDGTAQAGVDYTPVSGTVTFTNNQYVGYFQVPIINDSLNEGNETIKLTITSVTGTGTPGTPLTSVLTIINDDTPTLQIAQRTFSVSEGAGNFNIPVVRSGDPSIPVSINYATVGPAGTMPCDSPNGVALLYCDYAPRSGTLQFAAGETIKTVSIPIVDDGLIENTERFTFGLINPSTGANLGVIATATISITDNDSTGVPPPIELFLDESGPEANQAAAIDSLLALRDPFPVVSASNLLNQLQDPNTRVIVWVANLQLLPGEIPASVIVTLLDSQNHRYDVGAEVVQPVPYYNLSQVVFRLPDNLAPGVCTIKVTAHGLVSNSGTIRIGS